MPARLKIIGNYISPYVRKVVVCLELKGLDYEIDPIAPSVGNDQFSRLSPLRRIPVLVDDGFVLNDSSVICQYLEDKHPSPVLHPANIIDRAQARWLEEYADTRLADALVWRLFYQLALRQYIFGEDADQTIVQQARDVEIPSVLNYLESQLPDDGFLFGALSTADISIACFFRTASFVRYTVDAERWPRTAAFVAQVLALPVFQKLARLEDCILRLPQAEQRGALMAAGAPLTSDTLGTSTPQRGVARYA
jgi:glutathione S-transferase